MGLEVVCGIGMAVVALFIIFGYMYIFFEDRIKNRPIAEAEQKRATAEIIQKRQIDEMVKYELEGFSNYVSYINKRIDEAVGRGEFYTIIFFSKQSIYNTHICLYYTNLPENKITQHFCSRGYHIEWQWCTGYNSRAMKISW